jgi:hypothetical protein
MHRRSFLGFALGAAGVAIMAASTRVASAAALPTEETQGTPTNTTQQEAGVLHEQPDEVGAQWRRRWGWRRRRWRRRWWGPRFYRRRRWGYRRRYWRRRWAW